MRYQCLYELVMFSLKFYTMESVDANTLKWRRPEWRSFELNALLDELDQRSYQASKHPRKLRVFGSPIRGPAPIGAAEWTIHDTDFSSPEQEL